MRLLPKAGARPAPVEPPLEHIASVLEAAQTAQFATTLVIPRDRRDCEMRHEGFIDFRQRLISLTARHEDSTFQLFKTDTELLLGLTPEQQQETGKTWELIPYGDVCPYGGDWTLSADADAIRHLAKPIGYAEEEHNGETLHHHVLLVKPRKGEEGPGLGNHWEHMRWHGTDRTTYEFWLSESGEIRLMQQDYKVFRSHQWRVEVSSVSHDHWRFGLDLDLRPPTPDEILEGPVE